MSVIFVLKLSPWLLNPKETLVVYHQHGKMVSKFEPASFVRNLFKSKGRPETGLKHGFEEIEHEFSFGTFRSEKQEYPFRSSVAS